MTLVEKQQREGGFTFIWSIHNFSYCLREESDYIDSPKFVAELIDDRYWYLRLYPRGDGTPGFLSYYLRQEKHGHTISCTLSIRASNGNFKEIGIQTFNTWNAASQGYKHFLNFNELKGPDSYLDNDTLTLSCHMWRIEADLLTSVKCYAYTKIKFSEIDYIWTVNEIVDSKNDNNIIETKFNQSTKIERFSPEIPSFFIHLLYRGTIDDDTIHFGIKLENDYNNFFLFYKIHLLDADGNIAHSVQGGHLFKQINSEESIYSFPFMSKRKLLSKEKLYLPNGILSLRCQFSASKGLGNSAIKRYEYGKTDHLQIKTSNQKPVQDLTKLWKENMQRCYQEGKFSDVAVHTANKQFPVHKAILCAHSEVFRAMFEREMKENHTGIVEIEDLEEDTISKMLMFLYTNSLEDLDFSMACKLYFAADKYRITALHKMCLNYLIHCLDISNVCDVLVLADTHQDQELKSIAQDFIFDHDYEIINSEDWKKLMDAKSHLTSETMQLLFCKKFLGYLKP